MLRNLSYNDPKINLAIEEAIGKPFTLRQRWQMGGNGSPQLKITQSSVEIFSLLALDHNRNICNIELRPQGIIIRFRSLLETYGLVIPFYKLTIYKGKSHEYTLYKDQYFVKISTDENVHKFMRKLQQLRIEALQ
jgi:hypothetical protein